MRQNLCGLTNKKRMDKVSSSAAIPPGTQSRQPSRRSTATHFLSSPLTAYQSVPKYQESIDLTAQRAKEQLQGHVWPEGKEGAKIEVPREARKEDAEEGSEGGGEGGVLEGVKETVKQTLQEGVEKLKGGVETATEAIRKEGARHEEEMQAVAEEQRKKVTKKQGGSGGGGREGGKERKRG